MGNKITSSAVLIFFLLYLSPFGVTSYSEAADGKTAIAVSDLKGIEVSEMEAATVSELLRTELINIGYFHVVEKSNMEKILSEAAFQQSGCTTEECAIQVGKILNVQKMVVGSVSKSFGMYFINLRFVDVEKGISEFALKADAETAKGIINTIQKLCEEMVQTCKNRAVPQAAAVPEIKEPAKEETLPVIKEAAKPAPVKEVPKITPPEPVKTKPIEEPPSSPKKSFFQKIKTPLLFTALSIAGAAVGINMKVNSDYDKYNAAATPEDARTYHELVQTDEASRNILTGISAGLGAFWLGIVIFKF